MYGGAGKHGRGGSGGRGGVGVHGKRNIHSTFTAHPLHRPSPVSGGRLSLGGGSAGPRQRVSTASAPPSSAPSAVEETFNLVTGNPLNFAMTIQRLPPDLVEEIKRVEAQGGVARIKFDANANANASNTFGNVIVDVGGKNFRFTWSRDTGDLCDTYEQRQSGEDGNGLLVESECAWRKLNLQRVLDESTTNHVKMLSEEADPKNRTRKSKLLDHGNPSMKSQMKAMAAVEANPRRQHFKQKKESPFKKRKVEPPPGGPPKSVHISGLSGTTPSKGRLSASPMPSPSEQLGALASPSGTGEPSKMQVYVEDAMPPQVMMGRENAVSGPEKEMSSREQKRPYLLIDFSEYLRVNVYVLGAVFLQLCKLLSLEEHPIVQKPVDPSLFIDRFTERLLKTRNPKVSRTALRIIASMKRDWMQTGRKPSGLCGAALYISVLSHGLKYSKLDIVHIVHVCEATLTKRLIEFENTESGSLTIEEFNIKADELEKEDRSTTKPSIGSDASEKCELLCEHKGSGISPFAHGLCRSCYDDFMKLSGGLEGGSEPPAFQRAERERALIKESSEMNLDEEENLEETDDDNLRSKGAEALGSGITNAAFSDNDHDKLHGADDRSPKKGDESDSLSDIDDAEVENYLHTEEEKHYKRIIWENLNREYLEEQAAKEAAEAAAEEAYNSNFSNYPEDVQAAKKLAASTAAAVANLREERKRKRAAEAKNSLPAQTAAEATRQMLTKKRLSSKINYDVLDKLFEEPAAETGKEYNDEKLLPHDSKMDTEHIGDDAEVMDGAYSNYDENTEGHDYDYAHDADFFYDGF